MTFEKQRAALADVVAIPVTPFTRDGAIDRAAHATILRRLLDSGVRTLTPNGNTGEFYALTPQERRDVVELDARRGRRAGRGAGRGGTRRADRRRRRPARRGAWAPTW